MILSLSSLGTMGLKAGENSYESTMQEALLPAVTPEDAVKMEEKWSGARVKY
jgi:hypothetical protein